MCHMVADTTEELIKMAENIGVNKKWIQEQGNYNEHFDVCLSAKNKALKLGAQEIGFRDYARFVNARKPQHCKEKGLTPNKTDDTEK